MEEKNKDPQIAPKTEPLAEPPLDLDHDTLSGSGEVLPRTVNNCAETLEVLKNVMGEDYILFAENYDLQPTEHLEDAFALHAFYFAHKEKMNITVSGKPGLWRAFLNHPISTCHNVMGLGHSISLAIVRAILIRVGYCKFHEIDGPNGAPLEQEFKENSGSDVVKINKNRKRKIKS